MRYRAALLLAVPLLLAGCTGSSGLGGQDADREQEIAELKARVIELQRKAAMNEVEVARLRQQVSDVEGRQGGRSAFSSPSPSGSIPTPPRSATRTPPPSPRSPEPSSRELAVTPIEESDIPLPAPTVPTGQAKRIPPPSTTRPLAPPGAVPAPAPSAPSNEEATESVPPAAQALYDRGYTLFHQGHYVDAETSFQRFLKAYPKTDLSDNAQYWIGECRYSRRDFKGALAAFRETVERYPEGNKVPDALLKAGQSLEAMGDRESARVTYREVIQRFPGTAAAAVAEERRAKIP